MSPYPPIFVSFNTHKCLHTHPFLSLLTPINVSFKACKTLTINKLSSPANITKNTKQNQTHTKKKERACDFYFNKTFRTIKIVCFYCTAPMQKN